ncbi:MAG: T9SS type A sorting domain-containing protein [Flavobacteriales bacterium]
MKKIYLTLLGVFLCNLLFSQYSIGRTTITFNDPSRTGGFGSGGGAGRQIQTEIYYPANSNGIGVPLTSGEFPVIVFGHGFVMAWDAYQNIWEEFVPKGFIIAFPRTEGGFSPSHNDFAVDLNVVEQRMQLETTITNSLFYQKIKNTSAIMGHSMGGGSTVLAGANNLSVKTIIGLAPAETNPSAISAAGNVTVPTLIFSGSQDGVTPPNNHHLPIYSAIMSDCKAYISITGGAHCYFANSNFNCDFGESTASSGISITRARQQQITYNYLQPWLDFYLKGDCDAFDDFESLLTISTGITSQRTCNYQPFTVSGNVSHVVNGGDGSVNLVLTGGASVSYLWSNGATTQNITNLNAGVYTVEVSDEFCTRIESFEVLGDPTMLNSIEDIGISLFPNPVSELLYLNFNRGLNSNWLLTIIDLGGKQVYSEVLQKGITTKTISFSGFSSGFYMLHLFNEDGNIITEKIFVE